MKIDIDQVLNVFRQAFQPGATADERAHAVQLLDLARAALAATPGQPMGSSSWPAPAPTGTAPAAPPPAPKVDALGTIIARLADAVLARLPEAQRAEVLAAVDDGPIPIVPFYR
jgi:hypothetical protein